MKYVVEKSDLKSKVILEKPNKSISTTISIEFINGSGWVEIKNENKARINIGIVRQGILPRIFLNLLPIVSIYCVFVIVNTIINKKHFDKIKQINEERSAAFKEKNEKMKEELESLKKDMEAINNEKEEKVKNLENKIIVFTKVQSKYRLVLGNKLKDQEKEITFWRNVIKEIFIRTFGKNETESRKVIYEISKHLRNIDDDTKLEDPKTMEFYERMIMEVLKDSL